jgi:Cytochrome P450
VAYDVDFTDPNVIADPYPALARLREAGKPVWSEQLGLFLAATHADANQVLRSRTLQRIYQPHSPETEWTSFNFLHADSLLDSEPPKHTRLRRLVTHAFNPTTIDNLRPVITQIVGDLLDNLAERFDAGEADLIRDFAEPLPVKVIASLLGFPPEDEHLSSAVVSGHCEDV